MAKHKNYHKTLFFIEGILATEEEIAASMEFEPGVQFRSAAKFNPDSAVEAFDRLAGAIPDRYLAALAEREAAQVAQDVPQDAPPPRKPGKDAAQGQEAPRTPVIPPPPNPSAGWSSNT